MARVKVCVGSDDYSLESPVTGPGDYDFVLD